MLFGLCAWCFSIGSGGTPERIWIFTKKEQETIFPGRFHLVVAGIVISFIIDAPYIAMSTQLEDVHGSWDTGSVALGSVGDENRASKHISHGGSPSMLTNANIDAKDEVTEIAGLNTNTHLNEDYYVAIGEAYDVDVAESLDFSFGTEILEGLAAPDDVGLFDFSFDADIFDGLEAVDDLVGLSPTDIGVSGGTTNSNNVVEVSVEAAGCESSTRTNDVNSTVTNLGIAISNLSIGMEEALDAAAFLGSNVEKGKATPILIDLQDSSGHESDDEIIVLSREEAIGKPEVIDLQDSNRDDVQNGVDVDDKVEEVERPKVRRSVRLGDIRRRARRGL